MNSREKGKRGERQWRDELRAQGFAARRGQQFAGGAESPDVVCDELRWIHFEVKAVERLNVYEAMEQARRDAARSEIRRPKSERSPKAEIRKKSEGRNPRWRNGGAEDPDRGASEEFSGVVGDDGGGDVFQIAEG